jgi:hypothetical protein
LRFVMMERERAIEIDATSSTSSWPSLGRHYGFSITPPTGSR